MGNSQSLNDRECICKNSNACDGCLDWFHPNCVSLTNEKFEYILHKNLKWFCDKHDCQSKKNIPLPSKKTTQNKLSCTECGFIPKNDRGLKIHMRKHKKIQEDIPNDLIELLHLIDEDNTVIDNSNDPILACDNGNDNNCNDSISPTNKNKNVDNPNDMVPCLLCKDNKLYKRKGGLKIHCVRKHKNEDYSIMLIESTNEKSFNVTPLSDKISYY